MIVFYERPNALYLPYKVTKKVELRDVQNQLIYDKDGKVKLIEKSFAEYFTFSPGKNIISKELWLKIVEYNKENMEYYSTILKIFRSKIDEETNKEIGEDENKINLRTLNTIEMKDLIRNSMDIKDIQKYLKFEKERDKIRPSIIKEIKIRKIKINKADEALIKD